MRWVTDWKSSLSQFPFSAILSILAQEGLANLLLAVTDPGDALLVTEPCYPSYFGAAALAGLALLCFDLEPPNRDCDDLVVLGAARLGDLRLIDNIVVTI